jgi:sugar phosphate isomerase/epimerase
LAPYTLCLHIKDVRAKRVSSMMGFTITGTAAGDGQLDIPWIMEEVRSRGQAESLILELWPPQETPGVPPVELERAMAERGMQYLRELPALVAPSS